MTYIFYRQRPDSMIHDPAMRARHSLLYAEMVGGATLIGQGPVVSPNLLGRWPLPTDRRELIGAVAGWRCRSARRDAGIAP